MAEIAIPWGAWHWEGEERLPLPPGWRVEAAAPGDEPAGPSLEEALAAPVGAPPIDELAREAVRRRGDRATAAIAVEDLTRPAPAGRALRAMLQRLESGGIPPHRVRVILAVGAHAPATGPELRMKLGEFACERCDVSNHNPYENLVDLGRSPAGLPVRINGAFHEADVKLALGSVMPHPYAGFGGGGKIVLPGLAGIETLEANHRPAVTGLAGAGVGVVEGNRARAEMEEIALGAGLQAVLNIVPGPRRRPLGHFYGHPVSAHRHAVRFARKALAVPVAPGADAALLNAYPKDVELLQVGNVFNAWRAAPFPLVREGGTVVVTAACPKGVGHHGLHGPGMRLYRRPVERPYLAGRELVVYAPNLATREVRHSFWSGYPHARRWREVLELLRRRHPGGGRIVVLPTAPLTLPRAAPQEAER